MQAVTLLLVARMVDPANFGAFAGLLGAGATCAAILGIGASVRVLRLSAEPAAEAVASNLAWLRLGGSLATFALVAVSGWIASSVVEIAIAAAGMSAIDLLADYAQAYLAGRNRQRASNVVIVVQRTFPLAFVIVAYLSNVGYMVFAWLSLAQLGSLAICLFIITPILNRPVELFRTVSSTFGYWMANIVGSIRNLESTVVASAGELLAAGAFGVATRIMNPLLIPAAAIQTVEMPKLAASRGAEDLRVGRQRIMIAALVCGGGIIVISPLVATGLVWAVGTGYKDLFMIALGYSVAAGLATVVAGFGTFLIAAGKPQVVAIGVGVTNLLDLVLLAVLASTGRTEFLWIVPPLAHALQILLIWRGWRRVRKLGGGMDDG